MIKGKHFLSGVKSTCAKKASTNTTTKGEEEGDKAGAKNGP